jgi:pimeloyl-ACP methyl ester carboxylesterase
MTPDALEMALAAMTDADAAAQTVQHLTDDMKRCILSLYRSAVTVGAEWQPGVEAVAGRFPTLVLWGRDDAYVGPEMGERAAKRYDAKLVMFDGSGHWWPLTRAAETAAALEELWASAG